MVNLFVDLGKNLKAHREAAGYSQEQFSVLCGISRQSLHKHEAGKVKPTPEHLAKYAVALGISVTSLQEKIHPKAWNFRVFDTLTWEEHGDEL
jgi:transcriptional regulator with XRE-family HTH domain